MEKYEIIKKDTNEVIAVLNNWNKEKVESFVDNLNISFWWDKIIFDYKKIKNKR